MPTATPTPHRASPKGEKLAQRLSHILALLHQGDSLDKHQLAQAFNVDVRTIERDILTELGAEVPPALKPVDYVLS